MGDSQQPDPWIVHILAFLGSILGARIVRMMTDHESWRAFARTDEERTALRPVLSNGRTSKHQPPVHGGCLHPTNTSRWDELLNQESLVKYCLEKSVKLDPKCKNTVVQSDFFCRRSTLRSVAREFNREFNAWHLPVRLLLYNVQDFP